MITDPLPTSSSILSVFTIFFLLNIYLFIFKYTFLFTQNIFYTWHVTCDMWDVARHMWHGKCDTQGVANIVSKFQVTSSNGLGILMSWRFGKKKISYIINQWLNYKGVWTTAPASPGLFKSLTDECIWQQWCLPIRK